MDNVFAAVVDMETTGLSAQQDVPLEIGVALIDKDGEMLDNISVLVWEENDDFQRGVVRGKRNEFVNKMHTENGLWAALEDLPHRTLAHHSRESVDVFLTHWLTSHGIEKGKVPMLGNSIGSLDRPFALQHFPLFNEFLS